MLLREYAYFLVLTAVVVLSLATLYLNFKLSKRSLFDQVMAFFLVFLVFHSFYASFARYVYNDIPFVDIGAPFSLFYAPFFYTSLMALKRKDGLKWNRILLHFLPAFLACIVYLTLCSDLIAFKGYVPVFLVVLYLSAGVQFIGYALVGFIKFNNSFDAIELKAVTNYAIKMMVLVALIFLSLVFDSDASGETNFGNGVVIYLFMFFIAVIIFRYHVIRVLKSNASDAVEAPVVVKQQKQLVVADKQLGVKYEKSRISDAEGLIYLERLNKAMREEKLYLDSELTIDSLSKSLKMTKHHLTQVFTFVLNSNFNKHINQYRVIHASVLLKDTKINISIGDIGTESGFNSRTSFYRGFKNHFGVSPADYKKGKV